MKKQLFSIIAALMLSTSAFAGSYGIGVSGSVAFVDASGTETEGTAADTSTRSANVDNIAGVGSIFVEYIADSGIAYGIEYVPMSADVSDKVHERTDTSSAGSGEGVTGTNTRKASAEVSDFTTLYVEYPVGDLFLKAGFSQIEVETGENALSNGGTYGNDTVDGYTIGAGIKSDIGGYYTKAIIEYTDFDDLTLNSSSNNSITADLDVTQFKFSIGKTF